MDAGTPCLLTPNECVVAQIDHQHMFFGVGSARAAHDWLDSLRRRREIGAIGGVRAARSYDIRNAFQAIRN